MLKGTKLNSILTGTCPQCQESKLFCERNPYKFSKLFHMPEYCPACGLKFEREPGFYFGAMYVGYAFSVAYLTAVYVAFEVLYPGFELWMYFTSAITSLLVFTPVIFRVSRVVWINFFVSYDSKASQNFSSSSDEVPCRSV